MQQRFNRFLEEAFSPFALPTEEPVFITGWTPSCDIYETDNEIVVRAEVPGMKKEEINVSMQDNVLTISGERKFEQEAKKENYHRVERSYGSFTRSFMLPPTVEEKKITAEFKDGLLEVKLPKPALSRAFLCRPESTKRRGTRTRLLARCDDLLPVSPRIHEEHILSRCLKACRSPATNFSSALIRDEE